MAEDPAAVQSLISVLAHLARSDAAQLVECLSAAGALEPALQKWCERQVEIRTPYDIRLTTGALGALLTCPHPGLDAVGVRGKRTDVGGAIRTRARAAERAEEWSRVPARVKLEMLLADAYIEATTQEEEADGEGDWEEGEEEEDEAGAFGGGGGGLAGFSAAQLGGERGARTICGGGHLRPCGPARLRAGV